MEETGPDNKPTATTPSGSARGSAIEGNGDSTTPSQASAVSDAGIDAAAALRAKRIANLRPWKKGQSGNPRGPNVTPKALRLSAREVVEAFIAEFKRRPIESYTFEELVIGLKLIAPWAGMVDANVAWQAAMQALTNANLTDGQRDKLIDMLGGGDGDEQQRQIEASEAVGEE